MNTEVIIVIVLAVCAIALAALMIVDRRSISRRRVKYGAEYQRLLEQEHGRSRQVDRILEQRERRVKRLHLRHLAPTECDHLADQWRSIQEEFVDNPTTAVSRADALVTEALAARGYPMSDFEQRAADISVEHPQLVNDYRTAHAIAERDRAGSATTEELRRALQHYRGLLEQVLETHVAQSSRA